MKKIYGRQPTHIFSSLDEHEQLVLEADDLVLTEYDLGDDEYRYNLSYRGDEMLTAEEVHDYLHAWYDEAPELYDAIEQ